MNSDPLICYLGDDDASRAAAYLCGIMTRYGLSFTRVDSGASPKDDFFTQPYALYILSDYPAKNLSQEQMTHIVRRVQEEGAGLLMLGGWESYYGRLGEYHNSPLAQILPVLMASQDDRRNYPCPVFLKPTVEEHPVLNDLPWQTAPSVGGFNAFEAKPNATVLLQGYRSQITWTNAVTPVGATCQSQDLCVNLLAPVPFLAVDQVGSGRVAAFASDVAPHWIGGMVDWGTPRIFQELPSSLGDGLFVEIGCHYAQFFAQLLQWTAGLR